MRPLKPTSFGLSLGPVALGPAPPLPPPTPRCWTCGELWLNSQQQPTPVRRTEAAAGSGTDELDTTGAVAEPEFKRVKNLCDSNVDHYLEPFPREKWPDVAEVESGIYMYLSPPQASPPGTSQLMLVMLCTGGLC